MIISEAKTVKIGNIDFPNVKWRTRIVFEYENMTGESYYKIGTKLESQFKLFYCAAKIGSVISTGKFDLTYDQFLELTDEYFNETVLQFTSALYEKTSEVSKKKLRMK